MVSLSKKEQQVYDFIKDFYKNNGYTPTQRCIKDALSIKSLSTVHARLETLREQNLIRQAARQHNYTLVEQEADDSNLPTDVVQVPIIGRVAAGEPILAEQNVEGYFPIPSANLGKGNCFMLSVHGNSMIEAGILNGDYILVEEQNTAKNGEIVVAMVDYGFESEATVKEFYKEDGHIRLQPRNPDLGPIIVKDCKIVGKVKGVFRYLS